MTRYKRLEASLRRLMHRYFVASLIQQEARRWYNTAEIQDKCHCCIFPIHCMGRNNHQRFRFQYTHCCRDTDTFRRNHNFRVESFERIVLFHAIERILAQLTTDEGLDGDHRIDQPTLHFAALLNCLSPWQHSCPILRYAPVPNNGLPHGAEWRRPKHHLDSSMF